MSEIVLRVAAKAIIPNDKRQVLLVREAQTYKDSTQTGKFGIPGGRLELGEDYMDGLVREALEETGLNVKYEYPLHIREWSPEINGIKHQIIAVYSVCSTISYKVSLGDEHDKYIWISREDIDSAQIMELDIEVLNKYFERSD